MRFQTSQFFFLVVMALVVGSASCVQSAEPRVFGLSSGTLPRLKARLAAGDKELQPAFQELLKQADTALKTKTISVTEKPLPPASGDKHDYFSMGPYWWPDPAKSNGLPYIRKDGKHNPERTRAIYDRPRLSRVVENSSTLAQAYYLTGEKSYAEHAAKLLRVFFLDRATRMNPNMNHAQAIPGVTDGRGVGMIDSHSLTDAADAVAMLDGSAAWRKADAEGMKAWFNEFVDWALTSKNGKEERAAKNNHGTYYDVQVAHLALFVGRTNLAREILEGAKQKRLDPQLEPDGGQPLELAREDSFGYSRANLNGYFKLATLGEHVGVDLWHYQTPNGAGIRKALDFLVLYLEQPDKPWPHEHSVKPNRRADGLPLRQAYAVYGDERYRRALSKDPDNKTQRDMLWFFTR